MIVFLGDIAFYMATLVFAAGIYMIHHANVHDGPQKSKLLKSGGVFVTIVAVIGMLCSGSYWIKYYLEGAYTVASPHSQMQMMSHGGMNHKMMMGSNGINMNSETMGHMMGNCIDQMPSDMKMDSAFKGQMKSCLDQKMMQPSPPNEKSKE